MRCTCEANEATITRRGVALKTRSSTGMMSRSEVVNPGTSALVESTMNKSTPSAPNLAKVGRSVTRPSNGN